MVRISTVSIAIVSIARLEPAGRVRAQHEVEGAGRHVQPQCRHRGGHRARHAQRLLCIRLGAPDLVRVKGGVKARVRSALAPQTWFKELGVG